MNPPPAYFEKATAVRRFLASGINFLVIGLFAVLARLIAKDDNARLFLLGFITVYWLTCVLGRKSFGSVLCLLDTRMCDFREMSVLLSFMRSFPFYVLGVVAFTPNNLLPVGMVGYRPLLLLAFLAALAVNGIMVAVTGRSILDRWLKVSVWRLNLPDHLRPRIFGHRIV